MRIKELTGVLGPRSEFGRSIITRDPETGGDHKVYEYRHEQADLVLAFAEIRQRAERFAPPSRRAFREIAQHEPFPVETKSSQILERLKNCGSLVFRFLFKGVKSRSEAVATFLAVLELCRSGSVQLSEDGQQLLNGPVESAQKA